MPMRLCALIMGAVLTFFGAAGLVPSWVFEPPARYYFAIMPVIGHFGFLFGWLPTNYVHDAVYLALGIAGILSAVTAFTAMWYLRGLLLIMLNLTFLGLMPLGFSYLWGLLPLFSWNVFLHVNIAILAYYFGFIYPLDQGGPRPYVPVVRPVHDRR